MTKKSSENKDTDLPSPSYYDLNNVVTTARQIDQNQTQERIDRLRDQQVSTHHTLIRVENNDEINKLAARIATEACDETETENEGRKTARGRIAKEIISPLQKELHDILSDFQRNNYGDPLIKMQTKQSKFARYVAWRLRHGEKFKLSLPSTWILYSGEISENGVANKLGSFFYNKFTLKAYFFEPKQLEATQKMKVNALISEAVEEVSEGILKR